jgi:hypothetical protein
MYGCLAEAYHQKVVHRCNQGCFKYLIPDGHFHARKKWVQNESISPFTSMPAGKLNTA